MKRKTIALAIGFLSIVSGDLLAGEYGNHIVQYLNNSDEALAECVKYNTNGPVPGKCGGGSDEFNDVYTVICNENSVAFQTGLKNYVANKQDNTWTGVTCPPLGVNFYHFVYPITQCGAGQTFVGPNPTDCIDQTLEQKAVAAKKMLGKKSACSTGNPCDAATGNKFEAQVDFSGGNGIPSFVRYYNSLNFSSVGLGIGWTHSYSKKIAFDQANKKITVTREDSSSEVFSQIGSVWVGDADTTLVLETPDIFTAIIKRRDGGVETYSLSSGYLQSETDSIGRTTTLTYSGQNLTKITGPYGHSIGVAWSSSNPVKILRITLPDGKLVSYTQNSIQNLTLVGYPNSTNRDYFYENASLPHALTGINDELNNRYATYGYDANGNAILTEHAGQTQKFQFSYDSGTTTTVSLAGTPYFSATFSENLGVKRLMSRTWLDVNAGTVSQQWDGNNRLQSRTDELNRTTSFSWDALNRLSSTTDPSGRTTSFTYLGNLELPTSVTTPSVAAGQSKVVSIQYDTSNRPTQITEAGFKPNGTPISRSTGIAWTSAGQVSSVTDARGNTTLFDYWPGTTGGNSGQLYSVTNSLGQQHFFVTYDNAGRLLSERFSNGLIRDYTYDNVGNIKTIADKEIVDLTLLTRRTTTFTYNAASLLLTQTLPNGLVLTYGYDSAQRLTSVKDNQNNKVIYGYDNKNNRTLEEVRNGSDNLDRVVNNTFDTRNRISAINTAGSITGIAYDLASQITSITDPNSHSTGFSYDLVGRLTQQVNALNGVTLSGYSVNDEVTGVTAPNSANTTYTVDDFGNRLTEVSPDRGTTTYGYDANGNVTSRTDGRGITATIAYDVLNRVTSITYPQPGEDVAFTYDSCGYAGSGIGKLCGITDSTGSRTFYYDIVGPLTGVTWVSNGHTYQTSFSWDDADLLMGITYPSGRTVAYTRGTTRRVTAVASSGQNIVTNRTYRADGLLTGQTYGNSLVDSRTYDWQGRLQTWATGTIDSRGYGYDANGNILFINGSNFAYDWLDRLTTAPLQTFAYDPNGNRTQDSSGQYSYGIATNRMAASPVGAVTLDAAGNTTAIGTKGYTYNQGGRLVTASDNGTQVGQYAYAFDGHRASKTVSGVTTLYHYAIDGTLIAETDTSGNTLKEYVWDDDGRPLAMIAGGVTTFLHPDHLGSPRFGTDSAKNIVWQWYERPFGTGPPVGSVTVNLRYPGQYFDVETGLHQNWNRTYDSASGRYLESDPIGLVGGVNTYSYTDNNPLGLSDQKGLFLDTVADIGFVGYDIYRLAKDNIFGSCGNLRENLTALGADSVGVFLPGVTGLGAATRAVNAVEKKRVYSVLFETTIPKVGAGTRPEHFKAANRAMLDAIEKDKGFSNLVREAGVTIPANMRQSPAGWTWHHSADRPGVMQLVPYDQHKWGSSYQSVLHPKGKGGFSNWGSGY